ncbi:MAG TPA: ammonium transporter [Burkholderiales bacterium]|jgi:Amt family ammonium transporter|nr:ammonium transporter [Burkholderiales bacterium]
MRKVLAVLALLAACGVATAAEPAKLDSGDTAWMLISTVLVIIMIIPGLALFYGGMVRAKNALSVLMQVFVTLSMVSILWAVLGYSLAFSEGSSFIGGFGKALLSGITPDTLQGTIPELVFATFQLTFAAITPALIVGAFAERMKFSAVLWFLGLWLLLCYAPLAHMVWGGGWIGAMGTIDFAGGTVVHINAGIAGLVAAVVLGKRRGYGKIAMPPHNLTFTLTGAALLWAGWFGFNAGSAVAANGSAGLAMMNTQLATSAAVLGWIFAEWFTKGKPSLLGAASGAIAGLVAITPACGNAGPMGAIVLGLVAGVLCFWACAHLKRVVGYDDALDVFGVHGVGGIVGALGIGILASPALGGTGFAAGVETMGAQFTNQVIGVAFTLAYTGIVSFVLLKLIDLVIGLRVPEESESEGLDIAEHGEAAYNA